MNTPPFLLAAALLFWGWQTGLWIFGIAMSVALESSRWTSWRLEFAEREFQRAWDLTSLICLGAGIYSFGIFDVTVALRSFVQWLPLIFFPFIAAQAYGGRDRMPLSVFFWTLRGHRQADPAWVGVNVTYPYFGVCLLAAASDPGRGLHYYAAVCLLCGYALWHHRPKRVPLAVTILLFAAVVGVGYFVQSGFNRLQIEIQRHSAEWLVTFLRKDAGEFEMQTAVGRLGSLKLSPRVVLRLEPRDPAKPPRLLRSVVYNQFRISSWFTRRRFFMSVPGQGDGDWWLVAGKAQDETASISTSFAGGRGVLALPHGVSRVAGLPAGDFERNRLGVVRVTQAPEAARFEVYYGRGATIDAPPEKYDSIVPEAERDAVDQVATALGLAAKSPEDVMKLIAGHFESRFRYTTHLKPTLSRLTSAGTPLGKFLLQHRAGHCEYFASAAVLLLRQAGIPARYVVGYLVPPEARDGATYLIRERHGHAWALVFINGEWREFDPTPPAPTEPLSFAGALGEMLSDSWSGLKFRFWLWRWMGDKSELTLPMAGLVVLLAAFVTWRLVSRRRRTRGRALRVERPPRTDWPGRDSEFFLVERELTRRGFRRHPDETLPAWIERLTKHPKLSQLREELPDLIRLHYRYRFDPAGLPLADRERLGAHSRRCLEITKL